MTHPREAIRRAEAADVDFLAQTDLRVDEETGETYHLDWGDEQRAAHRSRIACFVHHHDGIAYVAQTRAVASREPRVAMLLARVRDLGGEDAIPLKEMFVDTLWPSLPPGWAPSDGRFVEMFQLWVHPEHRRRGIASELKQRLDEVARQRRVELLYTHTRATHTHVIALNEKLGYLAFRNGPLWDDVPRVSLAKRITA